MAKERIALGINLRQNKITGNAGYGKYYPEVDVQKTLSLRGFAKHMTDHGSVFGRDVLEAVLIKITECLPNWYRRAFLYSWVAWVLSTPPHR